MTGDGSRGMARRMFWLWQVLVLVVTVPLYAFATVTAATNALQVWQVAARLDTSFSPLAWAVFAVILVAPTLTLLLALWGSRRRSPWVRLLWLLAGVGVVAVLLVDVLASVPLGALLA